LFPPANQLQVLEVNGSPGLEGISSVTGVNVAGRWIDALESLVGEGTASGKPAGRAREQV